MSDLNQLTRVNTPGSYCLVMAAGINSHGEIAGMAVDQSTANTLAFGFAAIPSTNPRGDNQGCSNRAQNATTTNTPNALSRELSPRPVHRLTGLRILYGAASSPTVQSP
jgi:hypothetical protein